MVSPYRHPSSNPYGGLNLNADEKSRSIVKEILKSLGRKILEGNFTDIMRISRPACISFPMTFLQAASRDFSYCSFLNQAALVDDPVIRLQLVGAFVVSGLHINPVEFGNTPPLNPILGETYSAHMIDGTKIWLEQTSHHPPITHWYMEGPSNLYKFFGHGQIKAGLAGPNTIKASKLGKHTIIFNNGDTLDYSAPDMQINGVVLGQRTVNFIGSFYIHDHKNDLCAVFTFEQSPSLKDSIKGKISSFWKSIETIPVDHFKVKFFSNWKNCKREICEGNGSWLELFQVNQRVWWNIEMKPVDEWIPDENSLPSDSVYRHDLRCLLHGNVDAAQLAKDRLENIQRTDKLLRNKV